MSLVLNLQLTLKVLAFYNRFVLESINKTVVRWKREELVGRGAYGKVYRGTDLATGKTIAIKTVMVQYKTKNSLLEI